MIVIRGAGGGGVGATGGVTLAPGGGGAISMAGAKPAGAGALPNSCRTCSFMRAERSTPHVGHANAIGLRTISGEASNAYFAPQSQMTFMLVQGFGFSSTMFGPSGNAMGAVGPDDRVLPSHNKKAPPYL